MRAETFGEVLHRLRGDLSLRELARMANCGKSHISDLEHGRRAPTPAIVAALDEALGAAGELLAAAQARLLHRRLLAEGEGITVAGRFSHETAPASTATDASPYKPNRDLDDVLRHLTDQWHLLVQRDKDRKSTRLNSRHRTGSRMPSSA